MDRELEELKKECIKAAFESVSFICDLYPQYELDLKTGLIVNKITKVPFGKDLVLQMLTGKRSDE